MQSSLKARLVLENQFGEVSDNYIGLGDNNGVNFDVANEAGPIRTQALKSQITVGPTFGSNDFTDPSSAFGFRAYVNGANLAKTDSTICGVAGYYNVTGTNASLLPKAGIMGIIGDTTTTADAAVMAYMDGDGGVTTARAGFGIMMLNSTGGSHFQYGMDLMLQTVSGHTGFSRDYSVADLRLNSGAIFKSGAGAPSFSAPAGSFYLRTDGADVSEVIYVNNATGNNWAPMVSA